ncbi:MAG: hypothetical protein Fues2KO_21090 [Fuerstiella sp.]
MPAMGKLKPFLFGSLLGAGLTVCALQFHVVHSHEGVRVVPRTPQPSLGLAYVDVRDWDAEKWADRPELVRALVANGSTDLVASSVAQDVIDSTVSDESTLGQLREFLNSSATATEESAPAFNGFGADEENHDTFDEMFRLPFPQEARNDDESESAQPRRRIAQRELPDINEVLGDRVSSMDTLGRPESGRDRTGSYDYSRQSDAAAATESQRSWGTTEPRGTENHGSSASGYGQTDAGSSRYLSDGNGSDSDDSGEDSYKRSWSRGNSYDNNRSEQSQTDSRYGRDSGSTFRSDQSADSGSPLTERDSGSRFGSSVDRSGSNPSSSGSTYDRSSSYSSAAEETDALEQMLFGSDAADGSELDSSTFGDSTSSGSSYSSGRSAFDSASDDDDAGSFEDVTARLQDRAQSALRRAQRGFRSELRGSADETLESAGRYVREQVDSSYNGGNSAADRSGSSTGSRYLPPALKALEDGFDPFVE